jgi:signal peptidase I
MIAFTTPLADKRVALKRIVALPGEQVRIRDDQLYVNGNALDEPYLKAHSTVRTDSGGCGYAYGCEPTIVPPGSYFVLGDNRDNSEDSRYFGFIRRENVIGRVFAIYWSWDSARRWPRFDRVARSL